MVSASTLLAALPLLAAANAADTLNQFKNLGFQGYYFDVASIEDSSSTCCLLSKTPTTFSGSNSPLDEELSVHFRGPLSLSQFAVYYSSDLKNGNWNQASYYNAANGTANNVTFLTTAGANSTCLGKALTYADSDGVSAASLATVLGSKNLIDSNQEYLIFSSQKCPDSGASNSCGVYRSGIPAYHGFPGTTKMFLFEFTMPNATTWVEWNYNMPAIWFLNAKIPRTSQYNPSGNCSCWGSGCGEFDAFEVMNGTQYRNLFSTLHTYQGTGNITYGIPAAGYFDRKLNDTMLGGVIFGTDGTVSVFMPEQMSFSPSLSASTVNSWIPANAELVETLSSVTILAPTASGQSGSSSTKKSDGLALTASPALAMLTMVMAFFNIL